MATPTFIWPTNSQASPTINYTTRESSFGDGYVASVGDGINNRQEAWDITWIGNIAETTTIMNFFDERAGWRSFFWTNPLGQLGLYRCKNPTPVELGGNSFSITGTFTKAYAA